MTGTASALPPGFFTSGTYRRDGLAVYDRVVPARTALLVMNMQKAWLAPGAPFEPFGESTTLAILPAVNRLAARLREGGGRVFWFRTTTGPKGAPDYWATYFENFVGPDKRAAAAAALVPGSPWHDLYEGAERRPEDWVLDKRRFSAFLRNDYDLEKLLREQGFDTVVVAGTATNICCESTVREAMMRDFRTFMPHDAVGAPRPDGHAAGLRSAMQAFADIRAADEIF
ncbi:MAG: cysteine hydrolase [Rhodospirillaceae bacterium]|nr:cysteine hydrolase [Rhodospirillaceae bacterium]